MEIYTIGFTKKTAEEFFRILIENRIKRLIDIRLNNVSQLAGFTKANDFVFFLKELGGIEYCHKPMLAPSKEILDAYKKNKGSWQQYEQDFKLLLIERQIAENLNKHIFSQPTVLLCSEPIADKCHRRLVAEYLRDTWGEIKIVHL
jgi:uncharacterized protein (DUF488 family)